MFQCQSNLAPSWTIPQKIPFVLSHLLLFDIKQWKHFTFMRSSSDILKGNIYFFRHEVSWILQLFLRAKMMVCLYKCIPHSCVLVSTHRNSQIERGMVGWPGWGMGMSRGCSCSLLFSRFLDVTGATAGICWCCWSGWVEVLQSWLIFLP